MPNKIIKDGTITDDQWLLLDQDATDVPDGPVIVPLSLWESEKEALAGRKALGIWLNSDESPERIASDLENFDLVAINFPVFVDGRGFSYGRDLREKYGYQGEVRAIGEFIRDQLFFLKRCGFNAFALTGVDLEPALETFNDFSDSYQSAIDQPEPYFKRH
ncbi:MAG: DUF934 domain-containing protein [Oceanicoccus sp.]